MGCKSIEKTYHVRTVEFILKLCFLTSTIYYTLDYTITDAVSSNFICFKKSVILITLLYFTILIYFYKSRAACT